MEGAIWSSQIGNARFYTYVPGEFTFDKWKENFKAGRTFVSSGPVIDFKVNGKLPGDQLQVSAGEEISISAEAFGHEEQIPLKNLVIIAYGEGIDSVSSTDAYQSSGHLFLKKKLKINEGVWLAAFCQAGPAQVAHTTPVYITIGDGGFYNRRTLLQNLSACENYLQEIEEAVTNPPDRMDYNAWRQKDKIFRRIADTRAVLAALRDRGD